MPASSSDYAFMARAILIAKKGKYTTHPNPRVGCVIVKNDSKVGEGYHRRAGEAHAEINAISDCGDISLEGATAYVTLEPCSHIGKTPPCANALIAAKISRVFIAMQDPNPKVSGQGIKKLRDAGIIVETGLLEEQSRQLNLGFIKRMEQGLPWVRIKLAMSLDGRTAMASGESKWITGSAARNDVQFLRASADAVLTGIGTVIADDPSLNVRLNPEDLGIEGPVKQPARVIIDTHCKTPLSSKLLKLEGKTIIATSCNDESVKKNLYDQGVEILEVRNNSNGQLTLKPILEALAQEEINEVHVEAGAILCGSLIQDELVDEIIIYMAPIFMGSTASGLLALHGLDNMADKINLEIKDVRVIGKDLRLTIIPH